MDLVCNGIEQINIYLVTNYYNTNNDPFHKAYIFKHVHLEGLKAT